MQAFGFTVLAFYWSNSSLNESRKARPELGLFGEEKETQNTTTKMACKIKLSVPKSLQSNLKMRLSAIRKYLICMLGYFAGMLQKENGTSLNQTKQKSRMHKWKPIDRSSITKDSKTHWLQENSVFLSYISLFH